MFKKFQPKNEQDWIHAANQETQRIESISFPYIFSLGGLELSAINTRSSVGDKKTIKYTISSGQQPALISLALTNHSPDLSGKNVAQLGVEDLLLPLSKLGKMNLPQAVEGENSLQSLAITYDLEEWSQLSELVEKLEKHLSLALYSSSSISPQFSLTDEQISSLASQINKNNNQVRWLGVRGDILGNQGATAIQELAASLSLMVDYWDKLSDRGISTELLIANTELALSLSGEFYLDIAKFSAIRLLLYNVLNAYGLDTPNPYQIKIRAISGESNKSLYDPDANLMRNTAETLAATVAGADVLSLHPHDFRYAEPTAFGQRMAVNIQHLLKHEGKLQRVTNPVDGSYFLENTVNQLAEKAWKLFLEIEEGGGYRQSALVRTEKQFHLNIKKEEQKLLKQARVVIGTTRYANPLERIATDRVRHQDQVQTGSILWEKTRLTIDGLTEVKRPKIAILAPQTDNYAEVSNKITFITGIITTLGLHVPLPKQSLKVILAEDSPSLLIFCADDAWYQSHLAGVATQPELNSLFKIAVGRSAKIYELQQQKVINEVLNAKSDLTAFLGMINKLLP